MLLAAMVSVFPALSFSQVHDSSAVLGQRIGSEIDAHERIFFGLFPGTENFQTAHMMQGKSGGAEITITHKVGSVRKDTIVYLDADDNTLLQNMFMDYEQIIQESGVFALDVLQKRFARLVQRGIVFFRSIKIQYPQEVKVRMLNEQEMQGVLLFANEKYLVLASPDPDEPELWSDTNFVVIPYQNIHSVTHWANRHGKYGAFIGSAVGFSLMSLLGSTIKESFRNGDWKYPEIPLIIFSGVGGGLVVGLLGLTVGSTIPKEEEFRIDGHQSNYISLLQELRQLSIYFKDPSPEITRKLSIVRDELSFLPKQTTEILHKQHNLTSITPIKFSLGFDYGWNYYDVPTRRVGVWTGVHVSNSFPIFRSESDFMISLRSRFGVGLLYVNLEMALKCHITPSIFVFGGASYQPFYDEVSLGGYHYDAVAYLIRESISQNTFYIGGIGWSGSKHFVELQLRSVIEPVIFSKISKMNEVPQSRGYVALSITWGFNL